MDDVYGYRIEVEGQVSECELNVASPLRVQAVGGNGTGPRLTLNTDQSGLIGLIRHLHHRGYRRLSVRRSFAQPYPTEKQIGEKNHETV